MIKKQYFQESKFLIVVNFTKLLTYDFILFNLFNKLNRCCLHYRCKQNLFKITLHALKRQKTITKWIYESSFTSKNVFNIMFVCLWFTFLQQWRSV